MDLTSGLRSEIFRPIVTIIVPGILAAAPFVFLAAQLYPPIRLFIAESSTLATFLGFTISIGFGLLSQEMGSTIEVWCLERRLKKVRFEDSTEEFYQNWYRYLRCAFTDSEPPVGQRYIHELVLFLKFELSMASALVISWIGSLILQLELSLFAFSEFFWGSITCLAFILLFYWEAYCTAKILARVRKELLKGIINLRSGSAPEVG